MNRIEVVQRYVNEMLLNVPDADWRKWGYTHLYGVAQSCAMIALKRGVDAELAVVAGLLHDVATYARMDGTGHARHGAAMARAILADMGVFSPAEMDGVCVAIGNHSDKAGVHAPLDEALKDADVLQHWLSDPLQEPVEKEKPRLAKLRQEFGF